MKYTIPVIMRLQDNQDGGWSIYAYNNEDELIKDHPASENGEMSPERRKEILTEHNPYEDGYISKDMIEVEVIDGVARLAAPISFHAGQ